MIGVQWDKHSPPEIFGAMDQGPHNVGTYGGMNPDDYYALVKGRYMKINFLHFFKEPFLINQVNFKRSNIEYTTLQAIFIHYMKQFFKSKFLKQSEGKITTSEDPISNLERIRCKNILIFTSRIQAIYQIFSSAFEELSTFQYFFGALFLEVQFYISVYNLLHQTFPPIFFPHSFFSFNFFTVFQKISELYTTHSLIDTNQTQINQTNNQTQINQTNNQNKILQSQTYFLINQSKQNYLNVFLLLMDKAILKGLNQIFRSMMH
jgi:hypothetical protein